MLDVDVIQKPDAAIAALDPIRNRLLAELAEPASAAALAPRVGLARQKVRYHLKTLESHGLITETGKKRWGGLTERMYVATASSYVVSPAAFGKVAADPERTKDRLSAGYVIALAARVVREVAELLKRSESTDKRLATLAIDTEIRFRSAAERAAFSRDRTVSITDLVSRYHDESAPGGRRHRLLVAAHPTPSSPATREPR
jgi:DNA-binding transcriptional ArsR family regulator